MEKHILILTTTSDFLWKFERENVNILKQMGYVVHFAANMNEPPYRSEKEKLGEMGIRLHHIAIGPISVPIPRESKGAEADLRDHPEVCHSSRSLPYAGGGRAGPPRGAFG